MSVITQLFSASIAVNSAAAMARIGNWPDPMNARIGNWPDPMGSAGPAAGR